MKKLFLLLIFWLTCSGAWAQQAESSLSPDILTKKLEKVNQALSKKINKINRKLEKKLFRLYPQLKGVNVDSLLDERVYQSSKLNLPDSLKTPEALALDSATSAKLTEHIPDSVLTQISQIREELLADLSLTPKGLEVYQKMGESMGQLGKTEELLKQFNTPNFPELPNLQIPEPGRLVDTRSLLSTREISGLQSELTQLDVLMKEYKQMFDGWEEELLARVTQLEEIKLLQSQKAMMDAYEPLPAGYRDDMSRFQTNSFVKEKLQAKAEEIKQVGGKSLQEKFDEAQVKMTEAKEKFPSLESMEDAPKRPPNPYKDDPFLKRLKLGFNFQVNRQEPTSMDLALSVAYLMDKNARVGLGTSYRIGLEKDLRGVNFDDQVFGLRSFFDYTLFRSIYAEALYEWNNTPVQTTNDTVVNKQWVQSGMLGLGNRFTVKGKLTGNFTALYNFLHDERSPNPSPWVFRFGFEF